MSHFDYKGFTKRRRPHLQPPRSNLFITFRLAGSIPQATVRRYRSQKSRLQSQLSGALKLKELGETSATEEFIRQLRSFSREWFLKFEEILDAARTGPMWLQNENVAQKVIENLQRLDGKMLRLDAYCIMSNHVHTIFRPFLTDADLRPSVDDLGHSIFVSELPGLAKIMQSLKGRSAKECNDILQRRGQFWEHESFDHVIRRGKFEKAVLYVLNNPVKAGLVSDWKEWRWSYCRKELCTAFRLQ